MTSVGARVSVAGPALVCAVLLVVGERSFRGIETAVAAGVLDSVGGPAEAVGTSVVFPLDGSFVGYTLSVGCSAAFLCVPFLGLAAALVAIGRVPAGRGFVAAAVAVAAVVAVNQIRLGVVAGSMRLWGFEDGYERSHVLLGSVVSTLGVAVGLGAFVVLVSRGARPATEAGEPGA